jgi:hypothetical protein
MDAPSRRTIPKPPPLAVVVYSADIRLALQLTILSMKRLFQNKDHKVKLTFAPAILNMENGTS